jgi:antitoxin VapB
MSLERHAKLFRNGESQAVRIPREFEMPGTEVLIRKDDEQLIIKPAPPKSLLAWLATIEPWAEEFPEIADPPPQPVDL